tara:strand:+ start:195 stop:413 length:219 start_codon:yes stop_codon:yes gene_type:complete
MENDVIEFEQSIDTFNGTKNIEINSGSEGMSDVQAGIEFIYNMREHILDIGIATVYGIAVYAMILWLKKNIK